MIGTGDYFGSEADLLPGTRRGFGIANSNTPVVPSLPALTSSPSAPAAAPPPYPGASTLAAPALPSIGSSAAARTVAPPALPVSSAFRDPGTGGSINTQPIAAPTMPSAPASTSAPGNYVYAGFDPSNPGYANVGPGSYKGGVYSYLTQNNINPNDPNWATAAASALNSKYNTQAFNALDGQTLGYEDEYVHSAPVGYGLPAGYGYDPNAQGEFFWGSTTPSGGAGATSSAASAGTAPYGSSTGSGVTGANGAPLDLSSIDAFTDPSTQFFQDYIQQYMSQLLAPPYTDQQTAAIHAANFDNLEADRQAELQNTKEQLGALGFAPDSGVVASALMSVNQKYDQARAATTNAFATNAISRTDMQRQQALALAGMIADLPVQRLQVAEQAAGQPVNPANFFQELEGLANSGQNAYYNNLNAQSSYSSGMGQIIGSLLSKIPSSSSTYGGPVMPSISF